jgi:hypothetical protein
VGDANRVRRLSLVPVLVAGLLAGCGGSETSQPPGSPDNPLVGKAASENERGSQKATAPSFDTIVRRQTKAPESRFSPCSLVTRVQARAIVRAPVAALVEAPQGPTCIYQSQDTVKGASFVTLAVQTAEIDRLKRQLSDRRSVAVSDRTAYCGRYGQPQLHLPLSGGRVLTVAARCPVAKRFANTALAQLDG